MKYEDAQNLPLASKAVETDFYLLALKWDFESPELYGKTEFDSDAFAYFDVPNKTLKWQVDQPWKGYQIIINKALFKSYASKYLFSNYANHEALFLTKEEFTVLEDLFKKAYSEFQKDSASKDVLISYSALILAYLHQFYKRQFQTRANRYSTIVSDFKAQLQDYFSNEGSDFQLPTVSHFAKSANLSSNYFGDVVKHFTGQSPREHINNEVLSLAKQKLHQDQASVSEIAYSLGFEYPTYFTRFFKQKTGLTPSAFRKQQSSVNQA